RPPASPDDFACTVAMQLAPDGQVLSAKVVSSCGNGPLDRSVEAAVIKASPMPLPKEPKAFVPNVTVNFTPRVQ
ncbi:MAG TPA: TonB family protein, partial [Solimonas sp.]